MAKKNPEKRKKDIIELLLAEKFSTIAALAIELETSDMTIRRDLRAMEADRIVKLVHGGVILHASFDVDNSAYSLIAETTVQLEQKMGIGKEAAMLIEDGDIIFIDAGSTPEFLARAIKPDQNITVVCYSLNVLNEILKKHIKSIIFAGGYFRPNTLLFESPEGVALIRNTRSSKAFFGATGVNNKLGVTSSNLHESEMKRAALHNCNTRILMVDSSKFDKVKPAFFASIEEFDVIVTDEGIPEVYKEWIKMHDKELRIVEL